MPVVPVVTVRFVQDGIWYVPAGVTRVTFECYGSGSGGGATFFDTRDPGYSGGGGGYGKKTVNVAYNEGFVITVGRGGAGGVVGGPDVQPGAFGEDSFVVNETPAVVCRGAGGGSGGQRYEGGIAANCVGDVVYRGGNGRAEATDNGGGAGANSGGNGADAAGAAGATGLLEGGSGGPAKNLTNDANGFFFGGGGGGGFGHPVDPWQNGGRGGNGTVFIRYQAPLASSRRAFEYSGRATALPGVHRITFTAIGGGGAGRSGAGVERYTVTFTNIAQTNPAINGTHDLPQDGANWYTGDDIYPNLLMQRTAGVYRLTVIPQQGATPTIYEVADGGGAAETKTLSLVSDGEGGNWPATTVATFLAGGAHGGGGGGGACAIGRPTAIAEGDQWDVTVGAGGSGEGSNGGVSNVASVAGQEPAFALVADYGKAGGAPTAGEGGAIGDSAGDTIYQGGNGAAAAGAYGGGAGGAADESRNGYAAAAEEGGLGAYDGGYSLTFSVRANGATATDSAQIGVWPGGGGGGGYEAPNHEGRFGEDGVVFMDSVSMPGGQRAVGNAGRLRGPAGRGF